MPKASLDPPKHPLHSVDNALRLIQLVRDYGSLRLSAASHELGVSPSTTHRLLAMLVYHGFIEQGQDRTYRAGPALEAGPAMVSWASVLRTCAVEPLSGLAAELGESVHLMVRIGRSVRMLLTVEGQRTLHVGDRRGSVMPAELTSGGKALLACLNDTSIERLYEAGSDHGDSIDIEQLLVEMRAVRRNGYAINVNGSEAGLSAVGVALRAGTRLPIGAISVSTLTDNFAALMRGPCLPSLMDCKARIEANVDEVGIPGGPSD